MAQQVEAWAALPEDTGSNPSAYKVAHKHL